MEWKLFCALIAMCFAAMGHVPYIIAAWREKIHPHPYSWIIWTIVSTVVALGQWSKGAGVGALPTVLAAFFGLTIVALSLKHRMKHVHSIDHLFLVIALLGIVPWVLTHDPTISVIIMTCIDTIGFLPTIRKAWILPRTEHSLLYEMNVVRHVFEVSALQAYNVATALDPVTMIFANFLMAMVIGLRKHFARHPHMLRRACVDKLSRHA